MGWARPFPRTRTRSLAFEIILAGGVIVGQDAILRRVANPPNLTVSFEQKLNQKSGIVAFGRPSPPS